MTFQSMEFARRNVNTFLKDNGIATPDPVVLETPHLPSDDELIAYGNPARGAPL